MAKLALNKTTLNRESRRLKSFRQFVPALELKRKQLMSAREDTRKRLLDCQAQLQQSEARVAEQLPMLASAGLELSGLLQVEKLQINYVNLVGLELPELGELRLQRAEYSRLLLPHWVDALLSLQSDALRAEVEIRVLQQRLEMLEQGLQKTTQRLNLFDKVLIPEAQRNIRKIQIALSDAERAGVVRAKIAKGKRARIAAARSLGAAL
ncbi:V-type ATP synthase subunit D [Neptuniibacter halophilus]|uniref:V-type ATP synthase subunit D n=1 Tax=Neptuniibacter halophilus TaxID=651666 RepID=UPI002573D88A|nr:V-type ATP synthase subunit D [Neptuniibacter halophilus]